MSKTTKNLGLFEYEKDKDGASTFNIEQALNDNWDKLDWVPVTSALTRPARLQVQYPRIIRAQALTVHCLRQSRIKSRAQRESTSVLRQMTPWAR